MDDDELKSKLERVQKGWLIDRIGILIEQFNHVLRIDQRDSLHTMSIRKLRELGDQLVTTKEGSVAREAITSAIENSD